MRAPGKAFSGTKGNRVKSEFPPCMGPAGCPSGETVLPLPLSSPLYCWSWVSLYSLGWSQTHHHLAWASRVLGLQACATTPGLSLTYISSARACTLSAHNCNVVFVLSAPQWYHYGLRNILHQRTVIHLSSDYMAYGKAPSYGCVI